MQRSLLFILSLFAVLPLLAVPASKEPVLHSLPDGTTVRLWLHGDEFESYYTTDDGQRVLRLPDGTIRPDTCSAAAQAEASAAAARARRASMLDSTFPRRGKVRGLVILVNYSDVQFTIANPREQFSRLLNEPGYSTNSAIGSARDYFMAASSDIFQPDFDVYGPYTLPRERAYYGANSNGGHSAHAAEMIKGACELALADGVDFTLYDENNDGKVDNVFVYYAGHNEAEHGPEESVWPHRSVVSTGATFSGKKIYDYACTSELRSNTGASMCGIGTFCHEFSHVLGLPDLYDTGNKDAYTLGHWDIMCDGSYNCAGRIPPTYSSWERFYLGWLVPEQLTESGMKTLQPLETSNTAYLIAEKQHNLNGLNPSPEEYFLLENRQPLGWDSIYRENSDDWTTLRYHGMLVWHITHNSSRFSSNTVNNSKPLGVDIVEAANPNPEDWSKSDPFPGAMGVTRYVPTLNMGKQFPEQALSNIREWDGDHTITFFFGVSDGSGFTFSPEEMGVLTSTYDRRLIDFEVAPLTIHCRRLTSDTILLKMSNTNMEYSLDSCQTWLSTAEQTLVVTTDSLDLSLWIRHRATRTHCDVYSSVLYVQNPDGSQSNQITLSGISTRPVYITTPKTRPVKDITYTTAELQWEPQADAEKLYLSLYSVAPGTSSLMQSFENFTDDAAVRAMDWASSSYEYTTTVVGDGKRSLVLTTTGDTLLSEQYPLPVNELSFWVSNTYTMGGAKGFLRVEGLGNKGWQVLDSITVLKTTTSRTVQLPLDTADGYRRFRLYYRHPVGSDGGACIDAFTASFLSEISYVFHGHERSIFPEDSTFYLSALTPGTTYSYALQAYEHKSCYDNYTAWSPVASFCTLSEDSGEGRLEIRLNYAGHSHVVMVPARSEEAELCVFDGTGHQVFSLPVAPGQDYAPLPVELLNHGEIYIVKYSSGSRYRRKNSWLKFAL